ncbi:MAG: TauD/TfdA family dioxygenase [Sneathiella sp.]
MPVFTAIEILDGGEAIALSRADGEKVRFHDIWLRDNAPDPETRSTGNGQKLIKLADIPENISIREASLEGEQVMLRFSPEDKQVSFDQQWLLKHRYDNRKSASRLQTWDASLQDTVPTGHFQDLALHSDALQKWLHDIDRLGFAKMTGGVAQSHALFDVIDLFGYVRETNYGRCFEVRTEVDPTNLAYTGLGLQAHTDNPYRDPVPTLQLLYCIENTVEGGDSLLVDGFRVAERMRAEKPDYFSMLSAFNARFCYEGEAGVSLRSERPMIELNPNGDVIAVRFNNRSCASLVDIPYEKMQAYYAAYRYFAALVDDPEMAISFKLAPGEGFLVDNTRILHARTAYSGTGNRWFQGCYADKDGLLSTLASLENKGIAG